MERDICRCMDREEMEYGEMRYGEEIDK